MKVLSLDAKFPDNFTIAYHYADIQEYSPIIEKAKTLWRQRCDEYLATYGDQGTCVLGAGIAVYCILPRTRIARSLIIINQREATNAQGATVWESSKKEILAFLKEYGLMAFYECGNMD